jgi:hypothetical protein
MLSKVYGESQYGHIPVSHLFLLHMSNKLFHAKIYNVICNIKTCWMVIVMNVKRDFLYFYQYYLIISSETTTM